MQVATRPIFPLAPGASQERPYDVPPPGEAKDHERAILESQRRARARVLDIALCNQFTHFFTWTLNGHLIDRYDPGIVYAKVKAFLGNAVRRKGFAYVVVPEYHKRKSTEDKPAIHMHGLCSLGAVPIERAHSPNGRPLNDKHGRPVYNMTTWTWGFSSCVPIDAQYERAVNYVIGYIGKADDKIWGKWYLSSRNLVKTPNIIALDPIVYEEFRDTEKLKVHEQNECEIYDGLRIVTEEFPPLEIS